MTPSKAKPGPDGEAGTMTNLPKAKPEAAGETRATTNLPKAAGGARSTGSPKAQMGIP